MKKKRPRIKFPREVGKQMFHDDLLYGVSGCHVSKDGNVKRLDPMSVEDMIRSRDIKDMKTEKLTVEEIIERYSLTEEQIAKLREYENKNGNS